MNPITQARERAERWLEELDIERDRIARLLVALRAIEHDPSMLLARRPRRQVKAVLSGVRRQLRKAG